MEASCGKVRYHFPFCRPVFLRKINGLDVAFEGEIRQFNDKLPGLGDAAWVSRGSSGNGPREFVYLARVSECHGAVSNRRNRGDGTMFEG